MKDKELDINITESLLGKYFVKISVPNDNTVWLQERNDFIKLVHDPLAYRFPFHSRIREIACLSPGSVYEFQYKEYPPSSYCSLNGLPDLLNFIVPVAERKHKMFSSCGVNLYFINSGMEKFKVFHGNYTLESDPLHSDQVSKVVRNVISIAMRNVFQFNTFGLYMEQALINAARRTYFGAFVDNLYSDKDVESISQRTLPGIAGIIKFDGDKDKLQDDLERFFLVNYGAIKDWTLQFS